MPDINTQLPTAPTPEIPRATAHAEFWNKESWTDPRLTMDRSIADKLGLTEFIRDATNKNYGTDETVKYLRDQLDFMGEPHRPAFVSNIQASIIMEDLAEADYATASRYGLTAPIAEAARQGKSAEEITKDLGARLGFLPDSYRPVFIKNVQDALPGSEIKIAANAVQREPKGDALTDQAANPGEAALESSGQLNEKKPAESGIGLRDKLAALTKAQDLRPPLEAPAEEASGKQTRDSRNEQVTSHNEAATETSDQADGKTPEDKAILLEEKMAALLKAPVDRDALPHQVAEPSKVKVRETTGQETGQARNIDATRPDQNNPVVTEGTQDTRRQTAGQVTLGQDRTPLPSENQTQTVKQEDINKKNVASNPPGRAANKNAQVEESAEQKVVPAQVTALATILSAITPRRAQTPVRTSPEQDAATEANFQRFRAGKQQCADQEAVQAAEAAGDKTIKLFAALKNDNTTGILQKIEDAANATPGGLPNVLNQTGKGEKYEYLANEFHAALQEDKFANAYDKAMKSLADYANHRSGIAEIVKDRPDTSLGRIDEIDKKLVETASLIPGRDLDKTALDEAVKNAKEIFENIVNFVKQAIGIRQSPSASQSPSPSPGGF